MLYFLQTHPVYLPCYDRAVQTYTHKMIFNCIVDKYYFNFNIDLRV